jgi:hypothetical protein
MNRFDWVVMSYIVYIMNCNFVTHTICLLALIMYKYNELQMSSAIQNLSH